MTLADGTRTCTHCKTAKPLIEFGQRVKRGRRSWHSKCRDCRNHLHRLWKRDITDEDYARLMRQAGNACQLCGSTERLQLDHNHFTGRVRGVLCNTCNWALGVLETRTEDWWLNMQAYIIEDT